MEVAVKQLLSLFSPSIGGGLRWLKKISKLDFFDGLIQLESCQPRVAIHIICDRIVSNDGLLLLIGRTAFCVAPKRGDSTTNGGGPDPRDAGIARGRTLAYRPFNAVPEGKESLHVRSHNFH